MTKYVYAFREGSRDQKYLLGGKGANLAEMTSMGLPVPPGFTISTDACKAYMAAGNVLPDGLMDEVAAARAALEAEMGKRLGDEADPLLVSVRSGAAFSMPGMMDTVLNLGLNDASVKGLAKQTGNERFAYDSYRRFVQMFGKIVLGVPGELFEEALARRRSAPRDRRPRRSSSAEDLAAVTETFKTSSPTRPARRSPRTPTSSWPPPSRPCSAPGTASGPRIPPAWRASPTISAPPSTSRRWSSATRARTPAPGVAFTRNPANGESAPYGDFLTNAQGEDVVAGIRITEPLDAMTDRFPECHVQLFENMATLESHYRDMCDIEFTIEQGRLYMLQTRVGKRTAAAALRMAAEMVDEGMIDEREAVLRVTARPARPAAPPPVRPQGGVHGARQGPQRLARGGRGRASSSRPTTPRRQPRRGSRSSSSAPRPHPTTSTG